MNKNVDLINQSSPYVRAGDRDEVTSREVAKIAALGTRHPERLTMDQIQAISASCLTQRPSKRKPPVTSTIVMIGDTKWEMTLKPKEW